jgi:prepilin-type N-terminal cleavage/methylation domain-containing protein
MVLTESPEEMKKTETSIAGNWSSLPISSIRSNGSTGGYSLIELMVVLILVGLMITIAVPRFRYALLTDNLKGTTRRLVATMTNLRNEAVREQRTYLFYLDLDSNRFWSEWTGMTDEARRLARKGAFGFPEDVEILDVWFSGKGKQTASEAVIRFNKKGYVQESVIHLGSRDGRKLTLVFSPFQERARVLDEYVDFEGT